MPAPFCFAWPTARHGRFAAANPNLPADALVALLDDPEPAVASQAAANPALPLGTMRTLVGCVTAA